MWWSRQYMNSDTKKICSPNSTMATIGGFAATILMKRTRHGICLMVGKGPIRPTSASTLLERPSTTFSIARTGRRADPAFSGSRCQNEADISLLRRLAVGWRPGIVVMFRVLAQHRGRVRNSFRSLGSIRTGRHDTSKFGSVDEVYSGTLGGTWTNLKADRTETTNSSR